MKAFSNFRMSRTGKTDVIWQAVDTLFPFECTTCRRFFANGGKRFVASSLALQSHQTTVACQCEDCKNGVNPFRIKTPVLSERRTTLD